MRDLSVLDLLQEVLGHRVELDRQPARPGDVRHSQADNARLRALFPGVEAFPLRDGIERTVEWMRTLLCTSPSAAA